MHTSFLSVPGAGEGSLSLQRQMKCARSGGGSSSKITPILCICPSLISSGYYSHCKPQSRDVTGLNLLSHALFETNYSLAVMRRWAVNVTAAYLNGLRSPCDVCPWE